MSDVTSWLRKLPGKETCHLTRPTSWHARKNQAQALRRSSTDLLPFGKLQSSLLISDPSRQTAECALPNRQIPHEAPVAAGIYLNIVDILLPYDHVCLVREGKDG